MAVLQLLWSNGKCREEKRKQYDEKKMILKLNSTKNEKKKKERAREREKKREKERSEKEQHQDIETLYPPPRKWYTSNLRASSRKREEAREKKYIYIFTTSLNT
jgi:hypothetical protein